MPRCDRDTCKVMWELGDVHAERWIMGTRRWINSAASARRGSGDVRRVRTGAGTPPVTLRKIGRGHREEPVLRRRHIGHVVAEAHLAAVRAMDRGWRSADGCRDVQVQCRVESMDVHSVRRAKAALTCSEDETVAKGFSLYCQGPTLASSSTSLTAVSELHTPWSHILSCWLPLLVDAGARSCR